MPRWVQTVDEWLTSRKSIDKFADYDLITYGHWLEACCSMQCKQDGRVYVSAKLLLRELCYIVIEKRKEVRESLLHMLESYLVTSSCGSFVYHSFRPYLGKEYNYLYHGEAADYGRKNVIVENVKLVYEMLPHDMDPFTFPFGGRIVMDNK